MSTGAQEISPQLLIERRMHEVIALGNYEAAYLFTEEGLPMAQAKRDDRDETSLLEISMTLSEIRNAVEQLAGVHRLKEIIIDGGEKRIIFRFFRALDQNVTLVVVAPKGKSYKQHTNRLQRAISALSLD